MRSRSSKLAALTTGALAAVALAAGALAACNPPDVRFAGGDAPAGSAGDAGGILDAPPDAPSPRELSCTDLPANCGDGRAYCCDSSAIPGGSFHRDFDAAGDADSGNKAYPAAVSSFRLDTYDVTVGRFRAFVNAGMGTQDHPPTMGDGAHPGRPDSGWDPAWNADLELHTADLIDKMSHCSVDQTWTTAPDPTDPSSEIRPINCLTWWEAMAFCIWDGGYLPTEVEWNYAAAGGDEQRVYAWSDPSGSTVIDANHASYSPTQDNCNGDGMPGCGVTDIVPVGSKPAGNGRWGHADLSGNVYQWVLDWYAPYPSSCTDCMTLTMPASPAYRAMRGGAFVYPPINLRTNSRGQDPPTQRNYITTARCAHAK